MKTKKRIRLPDRMTVWCNRHEESHEEIKELLEKTGIEYTMLSTSGPYTLWFRGREPNHRMYGPTAVKEALQRIIEIKESE